MSKFSQVIALIAIQVVAFSALNANAQTKSIADRFQELELKNAEANGTLKRINALKAHLIRQAGVNVSNDESLYSGSGGGVLLMVEGSGQLCRGTITIDDNRAHGSLKCLDANSGAVKSFNSQSN